MDWLERDAGDQSAALAAGALTAEALMEATLARIAAVNPGLTAIVALRDADALMAEARAADRAPRRGWLHGMPFAVKDLADVAGLPTSQGSPALAGQVAAADSGLAARLRAAGAIFIGKTNVPEFGLGSHSANPVHGTTVNPYDRACSAGGSSGGAGAALAARMVAVADGTDMMGSLRNPAAWNNVWSLRPTWGLVPSERGGDSFLHCVSTAGPMARSPADLARLLATLAVPDPRRPFGRPVPDLSGLDAPVAGMRIGWLGDWGGAWPIEPGLLDCARAALGVLEGLGCHVEELAPPFPAPALWESWTVLRSFALAGGIAALYDDTAARAVMKPEAVWEIERGRALTAPQVQAASEIRSAWYARAAELFERVDALALPATQVWPFPAGIDWPKEIAGQGMDSYHRWMEVMVPVSLAGLPCLGMPAGFGAAGLPAGVQVFGSAGGDAMLLRLASAYHAETRWPQRRPPPSLRA